MNEQVPSKELVDRLRDGSAACRRSAERHGDGDIGQMFAVLADVLHDADCEIRRLTGASAELLSICIQMREWLKPELVKEPDRTFFWKLNERIERFSKGTRVADEPPEEHEELIRRLRSFGEAYPYDVFPALTAEERTRVGGSLLSRISAGMGRHCSRIMAEAADALERSAPPPAVSTNPNEGPIGGHGFVEVEGGVLPAFHNHWSCSQCGRRAEYVRENGCPESCGRTALTKESAP